MTIYTPYTYLIGWTAFDKWYYGVRYALKTNCLYVTGCHPDEFWVTYFTSSKHVHEFISTNGDPDVIQIRKTFPVHDVDLERCARLAVEWEKRVLTRLKVLDDEKWINKSIAGEYRTTANTSNPLKNKSYADVYGELKAVEWNERRRLSNLQWWQSDQGADRKSLLREKHRVSVSQKSHVFQTNDNCKNNNKKRIEAGTHNLLGPEQNRKRIEAGTHNLLGPEQNRKRIEAGTHNLVGRVPCIDIEGRFVFVSREEFNMQDGCKLTWKYVHVTSAEGKRRKSLFPSTTSQIAQP